MKTLIITLLMVISDFSNSSFNMKSMEQEIKNVILKVEKASAERNVVELETLLHKDYRVVVNRFRGNSGATVISKNAYMEMMKANKIGGTPYTVEFTSVSITEHTSMVDLLYKSEQAADMHKYLLLIKDENDEWKVVSDLPIVLE